eukprot:SAG31_NODE_737_length_12474_cov_14.694303_11_plen_114_part_01
MLSRFCATIREIRDFNREKYGTNRESVALQVFVAITCTTLSFAWSIFVLVTSVIVAADGCAVALAPAIAATVLTLLVSMLAISPLVRAAENGDGEQSGLFQASAVSAYCHYLVL